MEYEITFESCNSEHYAKRITAYVVRPDAMTADTGLMHFAHGWGGNRYQYRDMQRDFAAKYDLVCVATEFRQSGYDFDATTGLGAYLPYDAGHLQVIDCLNAVRTVLAQTPGINAERVLAFGGSQGAHISPLMAVFCPNTFALVVAACGISQVDDERMTWAGRQFSPDELAVRDLVRLAPRIACPVVLMHGTADPLVSCEQSQRLEAALRSAGTEVRAKYYEGGKHMLEPVTTRHEATVELADDWLRTARRPGPTDFEQGTRVVIPCETLQFVIDWSKPARDHALVQWEDMP